MPYIKQEDRSWMMSEIEELSDAVQLARNGESAGLSGRLNFAITKLLHFAFDLQDNPSYAKLNEAIGVLECVKLELYRRIAVPYEDQKIKENGDVIT